MKKVTSRLGVTKGWGHLAEELLGPCGVYKWSLTWGAPDNIEVLSTNERAGEEPFWPIT